MVATGMGRAAGCSKRCGADADAPLMLAALLTSAAAPMPIPAIARRMCRLECNCIVPTNPPLALGVARSRAAHIVCLCRRKVKLCICQARMTKRISIELVTPTGSVTTHF